MMGTWDGNGPMMWGMGWGGLLWVIFMVLVIAALAKYLLSSTKT